LPADDAIGLAVASAAVDVGVGEGVEDPVGGGSCDLAA